MQTEPPTLTTMFLGTRGPIWKNSLDRSSIGSRYPFRVSGLMWLMTPFVDVIRSIFPSDVIVGLFCRRAM